MTDGHAGSSQSGMNGTRQSGGASAGRMRRLRERRQRGAVLVAIEVVPQAIGRLVELHWLRPEKRHDRNAVAQAVLDQPDATQAEWATRIGRSKATVNRKLMRLEKQKLVSHTLDRWTLAPRDIKEAAHGRA